MILTATKTLDQNANAADAAKRGAFWDLTEYLQDSEAYPNLSQISPDVLKGLTVDRPDHRHPPLPRIGRNGLGYRTDWAEAVGITEAPKTVEDVYDMLYKFTYDDPDGNGANDTLRSGNVQIHRPVGYYPDMVRLRQRLGRAGRQAGSRTPDR